MTQRFASLLLSLALSAAYLPVSFASAQTMALESQARRLFEERHLDGAVVVQDVGTGAIVVSASVGEGSNTLPLSTAKLLLLASYWDHQSKLPSTVSPNIDEIIARGLDDPGRELALELRRALGTKALLDDLARFGFPQCQPALEDCTTLSRSTSDPDWADAMSLGETHFRTTLLGLSRFLSAVGNKGKSHSSERIMTARTAERLQAAMMGTVEFGTARGIRQRIGSVGRIGGKTGSGPAGPQPFDGIFAGLVLDGGGTARYTVVTYVRRGGYGGGVAAEISADLAVHLLRGQH